MFVSPPALSGLAIAAVFLWLGMVLAISFLEAPLKFRAPGVTVPIGLGIGRLVFRALNIAEALFAAVLVVVCLLAVEAGELDTAVGGLVAACVVVLAVQMFAVRPQLNQRTRAVLAGHDGPRSNAHHGYVVLEGLKVLALAALGVTLLTP